MCGQSDGCAELDLSRYGVPWRLIGAAAALRVSEGEVVASHAGAEVARHGERRGRRTERARERLEPAAHGRAQDVPPAAAS